MAFTFNGIGTAHYGKRRLPDGSYITTEWFVLVFVPLVPRRSLRVFSEGPSSFSLNLGASVSQSLRAQKIPLDKRQVLITYAFAAVVVGALIFLAAAN
jgi:hypothetical protein